MAKEEKPAADSEAPPKKSKKLLVIIIALVVVILVAVAAAAVLLMGGKEEPLDEDEEVVQVAAKKPAKKKKDAPPVFVNLDAFTVNLVPETGDQYLQVVLSVELDEAPSQATLSTMMPRVRNNVTLLLSSKKASELQSKEGKEKLALEIRDEINSAIEPPVRNRKGELVAPEGPVTSVLFTSFIIQ